MIASYLRIGSYQCKLSTVLKSMLKSVENIKRENNNLIWIIES